MSTVTDLTPVYDNMTRKERKAAKKAGLLIMATDMRTGWLSHFTVDPERGVVERHGKGGSEVHPLAGVSAVLNLNTGGSTVTSDIIATVSGQGFAWVIKQRANRTAKGGLAVWIAQVSMYAS